MNAKRLFVNALTFARVPLILIWAVIAVVTQTNVAHLTTGEAVTWALVAGAAMFLAGITDLFDGKLARKWGVVSALGKMADPLMDKVFFIVAFPMLLWQSMAVGGEGATWHSVSLLVFTILYSLRDTWVTFLRSVGSMYGADVAAMWIGKVRTALSFPGAGWIYAYCCFHRHFPAAWQGPWIVSCYVVEGALIALTLWSLSTYTAAYLPYLRLALERK